MAAVSIIFIMNNEQSDDGKLLEFKLFNNNNENVNDLMITTYKNHSLYIICY